MNPFPPFKTYRVLEHGETVEATDLQLCHGFDKPYWTDERLEEFGCISDHWAGMKVGEGYLSEFKNHFFRKIK